MQPNNDQTNYQKEVNRLEVARLAYLNWKHDGCPQGQDMRYWLEAECQLKATLHLLSEEVGLEARPNGQSRPSPSGSKSRQKISLPAKPATKIKTARTRS